MNSAYENPSGWRKGLVFGLCLLIMHCEVLFGGARAAAMDAQDDDGRKTLLALESTKVRAYMVDALERYDIVLLKNLFSCLPWKEQLREIQQLIGPAQQHAVTTLVDKGLQPYEAASLVLFGDKTHKDTSFSDSIQYLSVLRSLPKKTETKRTTVSAQMAATYMLALGAHALLGSMLSSRLIDNGYDAHVSIVAGGLLFVLLTHYIPVNIAINVYTPILIGAATSGTGNLAQLLGEPLGSLIDSRVCGALVALLYIPLIFFPEERAQENNEPETLKFARMQTFAAWIRALDDSVLRKEDKFRVLINPRQFVAHYPDIVIKRCDTKERAAILEGLLDAQIPFASLPFYEQSIDFRRALEWACLTHFPQGVQICLRCPHLITQDARMLERVSKFYEVHKGENVYGLPGFLNLLKAAQDQHDRDLAGIFLQTK